MDAGKKIGKFFSWFKSVKNILELAMLVATASMAIYTAKMAKETKNLVSQDLVPYITPLDIHLQMIDDTGTPKKEVTYLGGAEPVGAVKNIVSSILSVKFYNSGRLPGGLRVKSITSSFGELKEWEDYSFVIPAQHESGWLFGHSFSSVELCSAPTPTTIYYDYQLESFNTETNFLGEVDFSVECTFPNTNCFILPYGKRLPKQIQ